MDIGASIFFTAYSIGPAELAVALEERGFESLWVAEHSHIPVTRRFTLPGTMELSPQYYDVMDPFVTLSAAAVATRRLKLATAICLVIQRDTIQTAKLVASLDQLSQGRFVFGIGGGWNAEEMEDHGTVYATRFQKMREQIEAMKLIWTEDVAEYHGQIVDFPPMISRPKPVQRPYPPIIVGGAFRHAARRALRYGDGILPQGENQGSGSPEEFMPRFRAMAKEAGRGELPVTIGNAPEDLDRLKRLRDIGVERANLRLPAEPAVAILPILDRWAELIRKLNG
jgi:probable F420-dependent oxidoreductase